jgi:hypothetical protein
MRDWRGFLKFLVMIGQVAILLALSAQSEQLKVESNLRIRLTSNVFDSGEIISLIRMEPLPHSCRTGVSYSGAFLEKGKWHGGNLPAVPYSLNDDSWK